MSPSPLLAIRNRAGGITNRLFGFRVKAVQEIRNKRFEKAEL